MAGRMSNHARVLGWGAGLLVLMPAIGQWSGAGMPGETPPGDTGPAFDAALAEPPLPVKAMPVEGPCGGVGTATAAHPVLNRMQLSAFRMP